MPAGTRDDPWSLTTAPGTSAYTMWADGGYRGRFGMSIPPLLEALGRVELTHQPRNNRVVR